jgi:hypothetical protein
MLRPAFFYGSAAAAGWGIHKMSGPSVPDWVIVPVVVLFLGLALFLKSRGRRSLDGS